MAIKPEEETTETFNNQIKQADRFHWSMRLMSLLSLLTLGMYTYVLLLCRKAGRMPQKYNLDNNTRLRLSIMAYSMDLSISAYFGAITQLLLKRGGFTYDRTNMPRPLFWFFAITGFLPTASMSLTVYSAHRWKKEISEKRNWRIFHGVMALVAYFSWWVCCAPVIYIGIVGDKRAIEWARQHGLIR